MKRKLIEKIPWQSKGRKRRMAAVAGIHNVGGEDVLIVDFALDKPVMRIALSHKDFENYIPEESPCINTPRWGRRQYQDFWNSGGLYLPSGPHQGQETLADKETADTIHRFVHGADEDIHTDWNRDIEYLQYRINQAKREKEEERRRQRITRKMAAVPEPSDAFKRWAQSFTDIHIMRVNPFRERKAAKAVCSACGKEQEYRRGEIRPNTKTECPHCGAVCQVRRADYESGLPVCTYEFKKEVILFQRIGSEFCERHFITMRLVYTSWEEAWLTEIGRIFHNPDCRDRRRNDKTYFNKYNPWSEETFWDDKNLSGMENIVLRPGPVYPYTINAKMFAATKYQYCAMEKIKNAEGFMPICYLNKYDKMPQVIEMMAKTGLHRMALEVMPSDFNGKGRPWEQMGISKKHLNRLRKINGGRGALIWMRYEEGTGKAAGDDCIKFFEKEGIKPGDIDFIADRLSGRQIMNYLIRQRKECRIKTEETLRLWRDYLSMALRMKMDVQQELIYKPKDVKKAHDDAVKLCGGADTAKRAGEIMRKFPDVDGILQSIKGKYEYKDGKYAIIVPEKIEDIIDEGKKLGHCLDKSDVYFDRIQRHESFIVFLRKTEDIEKPYYTLEIEPDGTARQKRTTGDKQDKDYQEAVSFIKKWQRALRKRLNGQDREFAAQAAELREREFDELRKNQTKIWRGALAGQLLADVLEADLMIAEE